MEMNRNGIEMEQYSDILWNSQFYYRQFYAYFITEKLILRENYAVGQ